MERTFRSMRRSSSFRYVSLVSVATNAPPAPTPAFSASASTGRAMLWTSRVTPSSVERSTWTASAPTPDASIP